MALTRQSGLERKRMNHAGDQSGFTLIELMVTIAVAAILVAWSIPQMNNLMVGNRLTARTNDLIGSIQYARSEAIKRGKPTYVSSGAAAGCAPCDWSGGWRVWVDVNSNGTQEVATEPNLRVIPAAAGFKNLTFTTTVPAIVFLANGSLNQTAQIKFDISTTDMTAGESYRAVCLAYAGMVTSMHGTSAFATCP
jgi:prepilin-type N-terminal cleavage/methylation domain-containing protein